MRDFNAILRGRTWTSCTIMIGTGEFCDAPVPEGSPISACRRHLVEAFRFCEDALDHVADERAHGRPMSELARIRQRQIHLRSESMASVVYYVRCGEYIKIGTTRDMATRMRAVKPDEILAVESGSYDLEARRHLQFAHLRVDPGREMFMSGDDLLEHIAFLQVRTVPA